MTLIRSQLCTLGRLAVGFGAAAALVVATPLSAQTRPLPTTSSGPSANAGLRWDWSARAHIDHCSFEGVYSDDGPRHEASYLRRGDMSGQLRWGRHWRVGATLQMGSDDRVELDAASIAYAPHEDLQLNAGRIDPDFGHENAMSSSWSHGIERSAIWDLTSGVHDANGGWGFRADGHGKRWQASGGVYDLRERKAMIARGVWMPSLPQGQVLQLGASVALSRVADDDGRIRTRLAVRGVSETNAGRRSTLAEAVSPPEGYDGDRLVGIEAAWQQGPVMIMAEALHRTLNARASSPPRSASGVTATLAWSPTGQARSHDGDAARFGRPERSGSSWGAWELFYRFDSLSVSDKLAGAREAIVHTLGASWFTDEHWRVMANLHWATSDDPNSVGQRDGTAWAIRLQASY